MILFRQKYPRWWFDWNLELNRLSTRVAAYLALLRDGGGGLLARADGGEDIQLDGGADGFRQLERADGLEKLERRCLRLRTRGSGRMGRRGHGSAC